MCVCAVVGGRAAWPVYPGVNVCAVVVGHAAWPVYRGVNVCTVLDYPGVNVCAVGGQSEYVRAYSVLESSKRNPNGAWMCVCE